MIAKMKFIKIASPVSKLDYLLDNFVSKYEIQIENAVAELDKLKNLVSHNDINPYKEKLNHVNEIIQGIDFSNHECKEILSKEEAISLFDKYKTELDEIILGKNEIENRYKEKKEKLDNIVPFRKLNYNLKSLRELNFIKFRLGRIRKEYYKKLQDFMDDDCTVFIECDSDADYIWGMYFAPDSEIGKVDTVYQAMYFERMDVDYENDGTFNDIAAELEKDVKYLEDELKENEMKQLKYFESNSDNLLRIKNTLENANNNFELRKQLAFIKSDDREYFILCGWMAEEDAVRLGSDIKEICTDKEITFITEDNHEGLFGGAPIKLKNPKFLKPFEMLIKMYGLPNYKEFDPTWFVAISYTVIFGMMFGDVGQGICLAIGGFLLYKIKKMDLAAIIGVAGIFSMIFGFMFGSIFGYEDIIEPLWFRPAEHMADLPFVGKMNTIFAYAIVLGMLLILLMMIFNIINAIRAKEWHEVLFDHNGVCGLIFYGAVVACVMLFMTGHMLPGTIVLIIMFIIPLVLIIFKEPLMAIIFKHKDAMPKEWGVFAVQAFFEIFEVLLSYFSNTLSFVRIGGFAVSHASMMAVVLMLAGAEHGGSMGNIFVIIIGNILVCGLEGLIVGIQVMRLEYYEMFSRFYRGGGREFKPYNKTE